MRTGRRLPSMLGAVACALLLGLTPAPDAGAQAWDPDEDVETDADAPVEPETDDFDPEPEDPYADDVEPEDALWDDVEPDLLPEEGAEEGGESVDASEGKLPIQEMLPADGAADRPEMPRVGIDLMYPGRGMVGQGGAALAFSKVGEDLFLTLNLSTVFIFEDFAIAPRLPLRLRVLDEKPHTKEIVRKEDWDEPSDFARLLAFFQYGHVGDPFFIRVGELPGATIGHGTFVNRYYNTIDIDHYQGGVFVYGDAGILGGELLLDNVLYPELVAARVFARPLDFLEDLPWILRKLKVGMTGGADFRAPVVVASGAGGGVAANEGYGAIVLDEEPLPMVGMDLEVPVVSTPHFDLVPYFDVNLLDGDATGLHAGTYLTVRFDTRTEWRTRLEYRWSGPGYEPSYFNPFYEIHRFRYAADAPKLAWLRSPAAGDARHGWYVESEFQMVGTMRYAVVFSDEQGPSNTDLVMKLQFPQLGPVSLSFFFARLDFDGLDDFFDPHNTVFAVTGRYNILDLFFVQLRVINEWWLRHTDSGSGPYETTTNFDVGFGILLDF